MQQQQGDLFKLEPLLLLLPTSTSTSTSSPSSRQRQRQRRPPFVVGQSSSPPTAKSVFSHLVNNNNNVTSTSTGVGGGGVKTKRTTKTRRSKINTIQVGRNELWLVDDNDDSGVKLYRPRTRYDDEGDHDLSEEEEEEELLSSPQSQRTRHVEDSIELVEEFQVFKKGGGGKIKEMTTTSSGGGGQGGGGLMLILTFDGNLTFHNLPLLHDDVGVSSIRGVITFSLDDENRQLIVIKKRSMFWYRLLLLFDSQGQSFNLELIKELPLPPDSIQEEEQGSVSSSSKFKCVLKNEKVCLADRENYSIIDLNLAECLPLLPISQAPNPIPFHSSRRNQNQSKSMDNQEEEDATDADADADDVDSNSDVQQEEDPRHSPLINLVGKDSLEFLIASHTGSTTLGVFINHSGEPCRGTLEWGSNLKSLVTIAESQSEFGIALLWNQTLEIHDLLNQECRQKINLNLVTVTVTLTSLITASHRCGIRVERSLLRRREGAREKKTRLVKVRLQGRGRQQRRGRVTPPTTTKRTGTMTMTTTTTTEKIKVFGVGNDSIWAITMIDHHHDDSESESRRLDKFIETMDELIDKGGQGQGGQIEECLSNLKQQESDGNDEIRVEVRRYCYLRMGFSSLKTVQFESAFQFYFLSGCDPRIVVKLFAAADNDDDDDNDSDDDLISRLIDQLLFHHDDPHDGAAEDYVQVPKGVQRQVQDSKGIKEYILENLHHNYSPHLQPFSVENAPSTRQLSLKLFQTARDCLTSYLMKWRIIRRGEQEQEQEQESRGGSSRRRSNETRKIDIVVDTTLVGLLAQAKRPLDVKVLLASKNDCDNELVEKILLENGLYKLVVKELLKKKKRLDGKNQVVIIDKVLKIYTKVYQGEYEDSLLEHEEEEEDIEKSRNEILQNVFDLIVKLCKQREEDEEEEEEEESSLTVVENYGLWLLKHDRRLGLKVFQDLLPSVTTKTKTKTRKLFDAREIFKKMNEIDSQAADSFLEVVVLQQQGEKDQDSKLHFELVKRYLARLTNQLSNDSDARSHFRQREISFTTRVDETNETFLSHLISTYSLQQQEQHDDNVDDDDSRKFYQLDRLRLKLILFLTILTTSSKTDDDYFIDLKRELEDIRCLILERTIVYGKLNLDRQVLSLLLHHLKDFKLGETYSLLGSGQLFTKSEIDQLSETLELPRLKQQHQRYPQGGLKRKEETLARRKQSLARILVEMCLTSHHQDQDDDDEEGRSTSPEKQNTKIQMMRQDKIAKILETQATNLDTIEVLPSIPETFPLDLLQPFLSRSLRRSLHVRQEVSILKYLASGQNFVIQEKLFNVQKKLGPTAVVDQGSEGGGGGHGRRGIVHGEKLVVVEKEAKGEREGEGEREEGGREKNFTVLAPLPPSTNFEEAVELDLR